MGICYVILGGIIILIILICVFMVLTFEEATFFFITLFICSVFLIALAFSEYDKSKNIKEIVVFTDNISLVDNYTCTKENNKILIKVINQ